MSYLLLVDDNIQILDLYKTVLERAGHQVRTAETPSQAAALMRTTDFEIVVMDLRVPKIEDGLSLIRTVKDHTPATRQTPAKILVISGWAEDLDETPEKRWVDCVLPKPVRLEVLLRSISELLPPPA